MEKSVQPIIWLRNEAKLPTQLQHYGAKIQRIDKIVMITGFATFTLSLFAFNRETVRAIPWLVAAGVATGYWCYFLHPDMRAVRKFARQYSRYLRYLDLNSAYLAEAPSHDQRLALLSRMSIKGNHIAMYQQDMRATAERRKEVSAMRAELIDCYRFWEREGFVSGPFTQIFPAQ